MKCKPCPTSPKDSLIRVNSPRRIEGTCEFEFSEENEDLFACWNQEHTEALGTPLDYWPQDIVRSTVDPLYSEPEVRVWSGPFRFKAFMGWPEQTFETREEGARTLWDAMVYIPRLSVEESNMPGFPREGDVVRVWQIPFYDQYGLGVDADLDIPGSGYYFDVIGVDEDGHALDNADFTRFRLQVKRRTEFTPERRVFNET